MKSWPHFKAIELVSPDTGRHEMNDEFMEKLEALRVAFDHPMVISSAYRTQAHNEKVGGAANSAHLHGRAVDVKISGERAWKLVGLAIAHGFTGIGVSQKDSYQSRFIHLDDMQYPPLPRPNIWSY